MTRSASFSARAISAAALFVGFYILALGIAGGLAYFPILLFQAGGRGSGIGRIAAVCWAGSIAILWSILPRRDRFDPPFPSLSAGDEPVLFGEIETVARLTEQAMPAEVYLLPDFNAWVAERGGVMGVGARRVMGIGLPLLHALSVSEFKSVIAHEFGHYHAGDTRLGPWVYATRAAIGRTLQGLSDSIFQAPFRWYAQLFLRVSQSVSRQQEFTADHLSAQTIGAAPAISALRKAHSLGPAFGAYWQSDFLPAIQAAAHPPLIEGFQRYLSSGEIQRAIDAHLDAEMAGRTADPYDTHPSLSERIRALTDLPPGPDPGAEPSAMSLVEHPDDLETRLLDKVVVPGAEHRLQAVAWDDLGPAYILPAWQGIVREEADALAGVTPARLPVLMADGAAFARRLKALRGQAVPDGAARAIAIRVLGAALGAGLARQGWRVDAAPERRQVALCRGDDTVEPFAVVAALAKRELREQAWQAQCDALGIADLDLRAVDASL